MAAIADIFKILDYIVICLVLFPPIPGQLKTVTSSTAFPDCSGFKNKRLVPFRGCGVSLDNSGHLEAVCRFTTSLRKSGNIPEQKVATFIKMTLRSSGPVNNLVNDMYCMFIKTFDLSKLSTEDVLNNENTGSGEKGTEFIYNPSYSVFLPHIKKVSAKIEFTEFVNFAIANCTHFVENQNSKRECKKWEFQVCYRTPECLNITSELNPQSSGSLTEQFGQHLLEGRKKLHLDTANIPYLFVVFPTYVIQFPREMKPLIDKLCIQELHISESWFKELKNYSFPTLPCAKVLRLTKCKLESIFPLAFEGLPNLELVDLSGNRLGIFPMAVFNIPNLHVLDISSNRPRNRKCFDLYNSEQVDEATYSTITRLIASNTPICSLKNNSLTHLKTALQGLELRRSQISSISNMVFRGAVNLQTIDLSENRLFQISPDVFTGAKRFSELDLSWNRFQDISFIQGLPLSVSNQSYSDQTSSSNITRTIFVNMSHNEITKWKSENLANLPASGINLKVDLSYNKILLIDEEMLASARKFMYLNLIGNPIDCDSCSLNYFQQWVQELRYDVGEANVSEGFEYVCRFPPNLQHVSILKVKYDFEKCSGILQKTNLLVVLIPVLSLLILLLICILICFRFRWYFRYLVYWCETQVSIYRAGVLDATEQFTYDAFISYASQDIEWVKNQLLPRLENELGLKLCLHDRNFNPGDMITDNIIQSVNESRKVVLVVSESFMRSKWCHLETQLAQHKLHEQGRSGLILIKLTDIPSDVSSKSINYLMKTRTYLEWPRKDKRCVDLFWLQLGNVLRKRPVRGRSISLLERQV